jgi:competence protein ComEC
VDAAPGSVVSFEGELQAPLDFEGFAYREYLARQGIGAVSSAFRVDVLAGSRGALADGMAGLRAALLRGLNSVVPEPEAALAAGILLGVRAGIAPEVSDAFATAGLTHVVAISGWNIAIVAALAASLTRPVLRLPGGRWFGVGAAGSLVAGYVLLTGASPSVLRAALMAGGLVLARLGGSRAHALGALMLAALVMLLAAPPVLWDVGFQLSALATAGLIWFAGPMEHLLARWPAVIREPVGLTLAAQLTTLPVILLNFERLSLVSPAANVLVVPLVPVVMLCAALAAVAGAVAGLLPVTAFTELLSWATGGAAWLYLRLMIMAGQATAAMPLASVDLSAPAWTAAAWYPALLLAHRRLPAAGQQHDLPVPGLGRAARPLPVAVATLILLAVLSIGSRPDGRLHIWLLDVGQGDAILVRAPSGATLLVDGGPDPDLAARRLGETLPFWQRSIDVVLLTHPHEDHVAGLVPALERYRVTRVLEPGRPYENPTYPRFRALAEAEGAVTLARAGMRLALDASTALTILFPADADASGPLPEDDINNASVVALLEHGRFRALLTGDAEAPVERRLLERGVLGPVDVLKVGHHGSESSTGSALLRLLRPRVALISAGEGNEYGHPHAVTLRNLEAIPGLRVLRTDRDGSVEMIIDGAGIEVVPQRAADAGSIGAWPSPVASARRSCSHRTPCRRGSSPTRAASRASRPRRLAWCRRPACRWTSTSSRSPPCCTTSTSWRRVAAVAAMVSWGPPGWWTPATRSWPFRSPRIRSRRCSTKSVTRADGHP